MSRMNKLNNVIEYMRVHDKWTSEQTLESVIPKFTEEFEEVLLAITNNDMNNLQEELGDLLFHIVLMTQIAGKSNFDLNDVIKDISNKMMIRHVDDVGKELLGGID